MPDDFSISLTSANGKKKLLVLKGYGDGKNCTKQESYK